MDPRPINFQYRKPRLSNPTYSSYLLYASIYQPHSMAQKSISGKIGSQQHNSPFPKKIHSNSLPPIKYQHQNNQPSSPSKCNANTQTINPQNNLKKHKYHKIRMSPGKSKLQKHIPASNTMQLLEKQKSSNEMERQSQNKNKMEKNRRNLIRDYRKESAARKYRLTQEEVVDDDAQFMQQYPNLQSNSQELINYSPHQNKQFLSHHQSNNHSPNSLPRKRHSTEPSQEQFIQNHSFPNKNERIVSEQDYIYNKQLKPYNIITGNPNNVHPQSRHRLFPGITLENRMIERGQYRPNQLQNSLIY